MPPACRNSCDALAKCPGHPDALCGSFYCQSPVMYRGKPIGLPCQCVPVPWPCEQCMRVVSASAITKQISLFLGDQGTGLALTRAELQVCYLVSHEQLPR